MTLQGSKLIPFICSEMYIYICQQLAQFQPFQRNYCLNIAAQLLINWFKKKMYLLLCDISKAIWSLKWSGLALIVWILAKRIINGLQIGISPSYSHWNTCVNMYSITNSHLKSDTIRTLPLRIRYTPNVAF